MIPETLTDQEVLKQIVRGERPVSDLASLDMSLEHEDGHWSLRSPRKVAISATAADIAKGMLAHLVDTHALREWALLIQVADIDLEVENHPSADLILDALWDASFCHPISYETHALLQEIAQENGTRAL